METLQKIKSWLFGKDMFNIAILAGIIWLVQMALPSIVGEMLAPPIGMTYITKAFASVGVATILVMGAWFIFRVLFSVCSDYFDLEFKDDIRKIRSTSWERTSLRVFVRPAFFLALYFLFILAVLMAAQAKLF